MIVPSIAAFGVPMGVYNPPLPSITPTPLTSDPSLVRLFPILEFEFPTAANLAGEFVLPSKNNEVALSLHTKTALSGGHTAADPKGSLYSAFVGTGPGNSLLASFSGFRPFRIRNTGVAADGTTVKKTATKLGIHIAPCSQTNWDEVIQGSSPSSPAQDFNYFKGLSTAEYADTLDMAPFVGTPLSSQTIITSVPNGIFIFGPKNPEVDANLYTLGVADPTPIGIPKFTFINQKLVDGVALVTETELIGRYWFLKDSTAPIYRTFSDRNYIALEAGAFTPYRGLGISTKDSVSSTPIGLRAVDLVVSYLVS